jgi:hypothetical protein
VKPAEFFVFALIAIALAVAIERLVTHFCRRHDEDSSRLDAAMEAIEDQKEAIDDLLARETVPLLVKEWLLNFSEAALSKRGAHAMFGTVFQASRPALTKEIEARIAEFLAATEEMRFRDPEAYEVYRTFIYRTPIMSFLQRPETYKAMGQLCLRLAEEREPAAARDAALMTQESVLPAAA